MYQIRNVAQDCALEPGTTGMAKGREGAGGGGGGDLQLHIRIGVPNSVGINQVLCMIHMHAEGAVFTALQGWIWEGIAVQW